MFGLGILDAIKIGSGAIVGAILCFLVYGPIAEHNGRQQGAIAERAAWQEKMAEQARRNEAARQAAQAKINAIEREYLDLNSNATTRAHRISELEQALAQEKADNEKQMAENQKGGDHPVCVCPPAFSRGVSRSLNDFGRSSGNDTAKPGRPVR